MREIPDFKKFLYLSHSDLVIHLADIERDICILTQDIGIVNSERAKGRVRAYLQYPDKSATHRQQEADIETCTLMANEIELQADLTTLLEEKFFLLRLLDA